MNLAIELITERSGSSRMLLSIGYGNGHVVTEIEGEKTIGSVLTFIANHRAEQGAHWTEFGCFAACPVTLTLSHDLIMVVVDSDLRVDGFGQSARLYIPRELLDEFVNALAEARQRWLGESGLS